MTHEIGHNGLSEPERIADWMDGLAAKLRDRGRQRTDGQDMAIRANALEVAASGVRARLYEE